MNPSDQIALIAGAAGAVMLVLWLVQWRTRDAGIVDAGWAGCLALSAVFVGVTGSGDAVVRGVVCAAAALWGGRLCWHLLRDRVIGKPEDGRYQAMRSAMGRWAQPGFLLFFLVQAGFVVLFAIPVVLCAADARPFGWHSVLAVGIVAVALAGEWLADRQLAAHRADPAKRGTTCRSGLWARSRHPNYFFEWLHWWAYVAFGLHADPASWWLLLWPLIMYVFLRYLTGIPYVERRALAHRPDYAQYQREVPMFFPRILFYRR